RSASVIISVAGRAGAMWVSLRRIMGKSPVSRPNTHRLTADLPAIAPPVGGPLNGSENLLFYSKL
ncbi:MAG: hypothetical protein ACLQVW_24555, partial [Limisphaerales bacterium]